MATSSSPVTDLLRRWSHGDKAALDSLMPLIYDDLRRLANFYLQDENNARTLQSTALVHEVYLRLCGQQDPKWTGRAHFFAVAAKMIRRILVDHAREKSAVKRGGGMQPQQLDEALTIPVQPELDLVTLSEALEELAAFDLRKSPHLQRWVEGLMAYSPTVILPSKCWRMVPSVSIGGLSVPSFVGRK